MTACIVAVLTMVSAYSGCRMKRWFLAEFPHRRRGADLTEEEKLRWDSRFDEVRSRARLYRLCEIVFVLLGLPGMAMRSEKLVGTGASAWSIIVCNAIAWFGILTFAFGILNLRDTSIQIFGSGR